MSYSKRAFEDSPDYKGLDLDALRCAVCNIEATDDNKGRRIDDDTWLCSKHTRHVPYEPICETCHHSKYLHVSGYSINSRHPEMDGCCLLTCKCDKYTKSERAA